MSFNGILNATTADSNSIVAGLSSSITGGLNNSVVLGGCNSVAGPVQSMAVIGTYIQQVAGTNVNWIEGVTLNMGDNDTVTFDKSHQTNCEGVVDITAGITGTEMARYLALRMKLSTLQGAIGSLTIANVVAGVAGSTALMAAKSDKDEIITAATIGGAAAVGNMVAAAFLYSKARSLARDLTAFFAETKATASRVSLSQVSSAVTGLYAVDDAEAQAYVEKVKQATQQKLKADKDVKDEEAFGSSQRLGGVRYQQIVANDNLTALLQNPTAAYSSSALKMTSKSAALGRQVTMGAQTLDDPSTGKQRVVLNDNGFQVYAEGEAGFAQIATGGLNAADTAAMVASVSTDKEGDKGSKIALSTTAARLSMGNSSAELTDAKIALVRKEGGSLQLDSSKAAMVCGNLSLQLTSTKLSLNALAGASVQCENGQVTATGSLIKLG